MTKVLETKDVTPAVAVDKTLTKGLAILERLARSGEPMKLVDLARDMNLAKSGVHRLLQTLMKLDYVEAHDGGRYAATLKLWRVGTDIISRIEPRRVIKPLLTRLAEESGETVHLSVFNNMSIVYIDKAEGSHAIRVTSAIGAIAPAHCTATGKVFLSHQPGDVIERLGADLARYTPRTITTFAQLTAELAEVRRDGFAVNRGEWVEEVGGVGAPVWNAAGQLELAIGMTVPLSRMGPAERRQLARMVVQTAAEASQALGAGGLIDDIAA